MIAMLEGIPKISVIVITYKQERLIKRALDSLLAQKDYIYEICVSDDCSPDGTWEVLQEYDKSTPGLFKLYRQPVNVGIFENIEYTWTMPTGDLVYRLAGDDECGEGWFKSVVEYIQMNHIDYKNNRICIYGDFKALYPNGDCLIYCNNLVLKDIDKVYLTLRNVIGNRSACFSINTMKMYKKVSQGRSHIAETAIDIQLSLFSEKFYYIPKVGNIYYANVGISRSTSSDAFFAERQEITPYALAFLKKQNKEIEPIYNRFVEANIAEKAFLHKRSLKNLVKAITLKLRSYDCRIGLKSIGFKQTLFSFQRRLPHKHPIVMHI